MTRLFTRMLLACMAAVTLFGLAAYSISGTPNLFFFPSRQEPKDFILVRYLTLRALRLCESPFFPLPIAISIIHSQKKMVSTKRLRSKES